MTERPPALQGWHRWVARGVSGAAVGVGLLLVLVAATLGRCDAFGGTCPADPPPLWDDDVFGMSAFGAALTIGVPVFAFRPSRRRLTLAIAAAAGAALLVGLVVRSAAHG